MNASTPPNVGGTADSTTDKDKPFGLAQIPPSDVDAAKKLQNQSGAEFDSTYVSEMCKGHEQAIAKFEQAARSATDPELKRFASDTLTTLKEHNHMAEQLAQTIGAKR